MAAFAWVFEGISINAKPFDRRVSGSRMMATESTCPWVENNSLTSPSVNSCWRLPAYILNNSSCWSPVWEFPSGRQTPYRSSLVFVGATTILSSNWVRHSVYSSAGKLVCLHEGWWLWATQALQRLLSVELSTNLISRWSTSLSYQRGPPPRFPYPPPPPPPPLRSCRGRASLTVIERPVNSLPLSASIAA